MNPNFQPVSGLDRANPARGAGENYVARQQSHVRADETDNVEAVEDQLARVRILPQLAILERLNRQFMRINFRFHIWPERRERVVGLGP